jgi:hypothetical protein
MRRFWWCLVLSVAGCDTATLSVGAPPSAPPASTGGGGGGGYVAPDIRVADPLPTTVCPVDYSADLERRIAEVADRRTHDALYTQWRLIEKVANATSTEELLSATQSFRLLVDRAEAHGDLSAEQAQGLRGLLHCYLP